MSDAHEQEPGSEAEEQPRAEDREGSAPDASAKAEDATVPVVKPADGKGAEVVAASPATVGPINEPDPEDPEEARHLRSEAADAQVMAVSRKHTRRSFLGASAAVVAGVAVYSYLNVAPREEMQPVPLEDAYKFNAAFSRNLLPQQALSPTYPLSRAETLRINGVYGLKQDLVLDSWRLQVVGAKDAQQHPAYVPDVTAWDYQYMAAAQNEDKGHDTKVDPRNEAHPEPAPAAAGPPMGSGQCPPEMPPDSEKNGGKGAPRGSVAKMVERPAPAKPAADKAPQDAAEEQDDNHTGRKPRGMEEAGESDSTLAPHTPGLLLKLADITRLPRVELVTQFKCIEGWSQIVHWAGVRMADFLELYPPALIDGKVPKYVYMETPDGDYYTGYDLEALRHPQALLVTEMMGAPLTQTHGAPLRLHMPTKYGYKQIKRIALIAYTNTRPDDYWTKLGYDWYAGL